MAQGMRQGISVLPLKICGKAALKDVEAWMLGKLILPIQSVSWKPKIPRAWLNVTHFCIRHMVR